MEYQGLDCSLCDRKFLSFWALFLLFFSSFISLALIYVTSSNVNCLSGWLFSGFLALGLRFLFLLNFLIIYFWYVSVLPDEVSPFLKIREAGVQDSFCSLWPILNLTFLSSMQMLFLGLMRGNIKSLLLFDLSSIIGNQILQTSVFSFSSFFSLSLTKTFFSSLSSFLAILRVLLILASPRLLSSISQSFKQWVSC